VTSLNLVLKYLLIMELHFDAIFCSNVGNEISDADHIRCSRGLQVPHPWYTPKRKRPRVRPRTRWHDYISDIAWSRL